jgi:hypothetical protein
MRQTKKHMNTIDETQYFKLWGPLKLRLAQKNEAKNLWNKHIKWGSQNVRKDETKKKRETKFDKTHY